MNVQEIRLKLGIKPDRHVARWAIVYGEWAAHQCVKSDNFNPDEWHVTHVPSGYRMPYQVIGDGLQWQEAAAIARSLDRYVGAFEVDNTSGEDRWRMEAAAAMAMAALEREFVELLDIVIADPLPGVRATMGAR